MVEIGHHRFDLGGKARGEVCHVLTAAEAAAVAHRHGMALCVVCGFRKHIFDIMVIPICFSNLT